jgi:3-methyladenine DNA glycosylase AlkC
MTQHNPDFNHTFLNSILYCFEATTGSRYHTSIQLFSNLTMFASHQYVLRYYLQNDKRSMPIPKNQISEKALEAKIQYAEVYSLNLIPHSFCIN